ncbi:MAG: pentapeptide repeat-containing protein [Nitrososphaeraceae archaeon]
MNQNNTCRYRNQYFNYENSNYEPFQCFEEPIEDGFCIFHASLENRTENEIRIIIQRINEKINEGITNNQTILFIGYNFPELRLIQRINNLDNIYIPSLDETEHHPDISVPIYFSHSKFEGRIEITNYHLKYAYFDNCYFKVQTLIAASLFEKTTFKNCTFYEVTNFSIFRSIDIDFSNSIFKFLVKFTGSIFFKTNFNGVIFEKFANFASVFFRDFTNFNNTKFVNDVTFIESAFEKLTVFKYVKFYEEADFKGTLFKNRTDFHNVLFKKQDIVFFDSDLSHVSFRNTDITRIVFGDYVKWNKKNRIIDEIESEWSYLLFSYTKESRIFNLNTLEDFLKFKGFIDYRKKFNFESLEDTNRYEIQIKQINDDQDDEIIGTISFASDFSAVLSFSNPYISYPFRKQIHDSWIEYYAQPSNIANIISIYRNLRENYEFRLRYNEAGLFFIREMDLYRKYKIEKSEKKYHQKQNNIIIQTFSATGLYAIISQYGESVLRPSIFGIIILLGSIIFFGSLSDPFGEISLHSIKNTDFDLKNLGNITNLDKAIQRTWQDFIPLFPINEDIEFGLLDLSIKIIGGILTFGLITIALKRRYERKHRH